MKKSGAPSRAFLIVLTLVVGLAACGGPGNEDVRGIDATIVREGGRYWIVADSGSIRYLPDRVPASYRQDGLRVTVRGVSRPAEAGADSSVRHLEITSLAELKDRARER